jgi:hypothetical protein
LKNILLMTSTIAPADDTYMLVRKDHQSRLSDYKASLVFQVQLLKSNTVDYIIYADNSGFPLDDLREICTDAGVSDRVEFLSCKMPVSPRLSRYFLEINLISWAIDTSKILAAERNGRIWKLTGRYIIKNIEEIIEKAPDCDLYINCRNYPMKVIDFYLVAFTFCGYRKILSFDLERYRVEQPGEQLLRTSIDTHSPLDSKIIKRFNRTPRIFGIRGMDGESYSGWRGTARYHIRRIANYIWPALWI